MSMNKPIALMLGVIAVAAAGYGIYAMSGSNGNGQTPATQPKPAAAQTSEAGPAGSGGVTKALSKGALTAFVVHKTRKAVPELAFVDKNGKARKISEWRGRVVLLNLWATWCAPCRKEMPHLNALQKEMGSKDFEVVAISVDRKGLVASRAFLEKTKATDLKLYVDKTVKILGQIRAIGLPATVLIDRKGREVGRLLGPADWAGADAKALIRAALAEKS